MSEQDRFDWNDDTELDSTTVEQEDFDDFEDPLDGFADFDDLSDYEDLSEMDAPTSEVPDNRETAESEATDVVQDGLAEKIPVNETVAAELKKKKRRRGISAVGLGFLFSASILVAGVGIGGALLLAEGVSPRSLWQPGNFLQIDQLLNFADHPLNILYMVTMGIIFLALLGSFKMSRSAMEANRRTRDAEEMLDRLTSLNLDNQDEWQSHEFKEFAPAEAFVVRTLGAWRLQEARQKRLMGVEGELHRLEKALKTNSREDLTGRFDHPAVGRLADEMVRYFDAREVATGKLEEYENKDQGNTRDIVDLLQESRQWNGVTLDNLGIHCAALDDLAGQMDNLARHLETSTAESGSNDGMTDIIEGIRMDLDSHTAGSYANGQPHTELNDLVDRGSKLAFQIAMEVARLGPRGERLLPMSQALEDLTTGFRKLADGVNDQGGNASTPPSFRSVHKKLETLAALITEDDQSHMRDLADEVPDFGPAAARISSRITRLVDGFNEQEDRLVRMGSSFAAMTGTHFDSSLIPRSGVEEEPEDSLGIIRAESPARESDVTGESIEMDPFTASDSPLMSPDKQSADPGLSSSGVPGLDNPSRFSLDASRAGDMPLSEDEETVYDLEDFGAVSETDVEETADGEVYELADLGGVSLEQETDSGADEVFELSDFGMTPVPQDTVDTDSEEVHDLDDFGAMPLDQVAGSEPEGAPEEDVVYDLSDFSAKPMK